MVAWIPERMAALMYGCMDSQLHCCMEHSFHKENSALAEQETFNPKAFAFAAIERNFGIYTFHTPLRYSKSKLSFKAKLVCYGIHCPPGLCNNLFNWTKHVLPQ